MTDQENGGQEQSAAKPYRTFGRRVGQGLSPRQKQLVSEHLPRFAPPLHANPANWAAGLPFRRWVLEIGFGGGEHLLHNALSHPDTLHIGAEPFLNGVVKLLDAAVQRDVRNLVIHHGDARDLLAWLPEGQLDRVDMLYPDPWPKARHHKRRLFARDLIARVVPRMKPEASFRFASDIPDYVDWAFNEADLSGLLAPESRDPAHLTRPYADWPGTRYEAKALREGRQPQYLLFTIRQSR